jgi:hypothetical protein
MNTTNNDGLDFCNQCPFFGYDKKKKVFVCAPNDLIMGKTDNIPVPKWCGNSKKDEKNI